MGKILVVAGEASADLHASAVVRELLTANSDIEVYGVGGKHLQQVGAKIWFDFSQTGVVGVWEVIPKLRYFLKARSQLIKSIETEKPDLVLLLDLPDFNLSLAKKIKKLNPHQKIVYYISPQIWAWREGRVKLVKKYIDLMLVIFPFEVEFYQKAGVKVKFVGHPLVERVKPSLARDEVRKKLGIKPDELALLFLPGSRKEEINIYLPRSLPALAKLSKEFPLKTILVKAPTLSQEFLLDKLGEYKDIVQIVSGNIYDFLFAGDLALVGSGTATLECALAQLPMVILARTSLLNYLLVRPLVHTRYFGLPNLIAKKEIVPELYMWKVNPQKIYEELKNILNSEEKKKAIKNELARIKKVLGEKNASKEVAGELLNLLPTYS